MLHVLPRCVRAAARAAATRNALPATPYYPCSPPPTPRERCARYRRLYALVLTGRQAHNDNGIWGNLNTEGGEEVTWGGMTLRGIPVSPALQETDANLAADLPTT